MSGLLSICADCDLVLFRSVLALLSVLYSLNCGAGKNDWKSVINWRVQISKSTSSGP